MKFPRHLLIFIGLFLLCAALVHPVSSHANLVRSTPAANTSLDASPPEIRLWFTEPLEPQYSRITLRDASGEVVETAATQIDAANPMQMYLPLDGLSEGLYTVVWRTVSTADGHSTEGSFAFGIGVAVDGASTQIPINEAVAPQGVVIRWLNLLSLSLFVGSIGFELLVWRPLLALDSRLRLLAWIGWIAVGLTSMLSLLLQAGIASGLPFWRVPIDTDLGSYIIQSQYGQLWIQRTIVWVLVGLVLFLQRVRRARPSFDWAALGISGLLLLYQSAFSHAAAATEPTASIAADWLHLLATSLWIGGLPAFGIALIPKKTNRLTTLEISQLVASFSNLMRVLVITLAITGLYSAWLQIGSIAALTNTVYGRALIVKLLLFMPLLGIAAVNLVVTSRQLRSGSTIWVSRLRGLVSSEIVLTITILGTVGVMTSGAPARGVQDIIDANAAAPTAPQIPPYFAMQVTDDLMSHLEIEPGTVGMNEFIVSLFTPDGTPVDDASLIRLRFLHQEENLGQSELRPAAEGNGYYRIEGANLSIPGPWRVRMTVQRPQKFDTVVDFEVDAEPAPIATTPVVDNTIPPMERGLAAALTGVMLLTVGGFYLPHWRRLGGRILILFGVLVTGALMLASGVQVLVAANTLSGELRATDAWARPISEGFTNSVYLKIENGTAANQRLIGGSTEVAADVELHETAVADDLARMEPLEGIDIPSGTTLNIAPVGYHIMLVDLQRDLEEGKTFPLTLEFASGAVIEVEVTVQMLPPE
jgi:copper transport protein